jgi:hypothetical protein
MFVIVYNQSNGIPAIIIPTPDCLERYTINEIAAKDVPAGKKFKILDISTTPLPEEWPQETWEITEEELTDGVGNTSNTFESVSND